MPELKMLDRLEERAVVHGHSEILVTLAAWRDIVRPTIEREVAEQEFERIVLRLRELHADPELIGRLHE